MVDKIDLLNSQAAPRHRLSAKLTAAYSILILLVSLALTYSLYYELRDVQRQAIRERLLDIVSFAVPLVDGDFHGLIASPEDEKGPFYRLVSARLKSIQETSNVIQRIYTLREEPDGTLYYVVDSSPVDPHHFGEPYRRSSSLLEPSAPEIEQPVVEGDLYRDETGAYLSGYGAIYDLFEEKNGLLGIDIDASAVLESEAQARRVALWVFLGTAPLALFLGWWLAHHLTSPVIELVAIVQRLGRGELDVQVPVRSQDEIGLLAGTFNQMADRLRQTLDTQRESELRYRGLFENSPISLWEEDFSQVKVLVDDLRRQGVEDFQAYLREHPEKMEECIRCIRLVDVNQATLKLYGAASKQELFENVDRIFGPESPSVLADEIIAISRGQVEFEGFGVNNKLNGERIDIAVRWSITPESKDSLSRIIVSIVDETERKHSEAQIQRQLARLNALRTVDTAINTSLDLRVTLDVLLNQVVRQLGVDAADFMLVEPESGMLTWAAGLGFRRGDLALYRSRVGEGYAGRAVAQQCVVCIPDLRETTGLQRTLYLREENFVTYYGVPLVSKGKAEGVLEVFHREKLQPSEEWLEFLEMLAGQAAIAIDNAVLFDDQQRSNQELALAYDTTLEGWSRALDLRDKETEGHTRRVANLTLELAKRLGIDAVGLDHIRRGAILHDIGKMGIPDRILLKPGPLDDQEWEIMRQHPVYAYEWLSPIAYLLPALDIPYCHHEKWDGSGYPRGLKGTDIPIAARIFSVIDVWDALRSDRPYRPAWSEAKALAYIQEQAGKHFDPAIVEGFLELIASGSHRAEEGEMVGVEERAAG